MRPRMLLMLLVLAAPSPASAQIEECGFFKRTIDDIVAGRISPPPDDNATRLLSVERGARCFAIYAAGAERILFRDFVKRFEASRTDKQSGAAASGAGSTSVASQGPAAKVLSVAAEYGALAQSVDGQVVTIHGNLAGIPSVLLRQNVFPYCVDNLTNGYCASGSLLSLLRRASFSVSFDATRGSQLTATPADGATTTEPVAFRAKRDQISAVAARIELWNQRDTTSKSFLDAWRSRVGAAMDLTAEDLLLRAGTFTDSVINAPDYDAWQMRHVPRVRAAGQNRDAIVSALHDALRDLLTIVDARVPDLASQAEAALASYNAFFLAQDELIDAIAMKRVFALEYVGNRPIGQPNTSNVRLIVDWPLTPRTKLVGNGGATIYDTLPADAPAGARRYRDAQVALQLDHGLDKASILGPAVFSLAVYYQYQHSPALLEVDPLNPIPGVSFVGLPAGAKTVFAQKGSLGLFQAKLTLAPMGSNVKVPVSFTYSNRTELIDKPTWRGQVGFAYDFDSLFALADRVVR